MRILFHSDPSNPSSETKDMAYNPGPYSAVNSQNETKNKKPLPGYLTRQTMEKLWQPLVRMGAPDAISDTAYGMGWQIKPEVKEHAFCKEQDLMTFHTGGAIGASSVLFIWPGKSEDNSELPKGIVVAIVVNMQGIGLTDLAINVAKEFRKLKSEKAYTVKKVYNC